MGELRGHFRPEFLTRIELTEETRKLIAHQGHDPARPLRISHEAETMVGRALLVGAGPARVGRAAASKSERDHAMTETGFTSFDTMVDKAGRPLTDIEEANG